MGQNGISQIDPTPRSGWFPGDEILQDAEEKEDMDNNWSLVFDINHDGSFLHFVTNFMCRRDYSIIEIWRHQNWVRTVVNR